MNGLEAMRALLARKAPAPPIAELIGLEMVEVHA